MSRYRRVEGYSSAIHRTDNKLHAHYLRWMNVQNEVFKFLIAPRAPE